MQLTLDPISLLIWAGATQCALLAGGLVYQGLWRQLSWRLFAGFLSVLVIILSCSLLYYSNFVLAYPHWLRTHHSLNLLAPALFYLFIYYFYHPGQPFKRAHWGHFVPFGLFTLYLLPQWGQTATQKLTNWVAEGSVAYWFENGVFLTAQVAYTVAAGQLVRRHRQQAPARHTLPAVMHQALWFWWLALVSVIGLRVLALLLHLTWLEEISTALLALATGSVGYWLLLRSNALRLPSIVSPRRVDARPLPAPVSDQTPASLPTESCAQLRRLLYVEKLYREPELSLTSLAERLGLPAHQVSALLKQHEGASFPELINSLRVAEAQRLLTDPAFRHFSILAIGYEAGFSSKSAFYRQFRSQVGLTPSEFAKQEAV
ncbi:MAG: helix-turn-helix transcriptional regulator [Janthinobacterium lividum]